MKYLCGFFVIAGMMSVLSYADDNNDCSKRRAVTNEDLKVTSPSLLLEGLLASCEQGSTEKYYSLLTKNIQDIHYQETSNSQVSDEYLAEICPSILTIKDGLNGDLNNAVYEVKPSRKLPPHICAQHSELHIAHKNGNYLMKLKVSLEENAIKKAEL